MTPDLLLTPRQRGLLVALLALAIVLRVATLGAYALLDPSESRYAEIARLMLDSGQWLVPQHAEGVPFWGKPPLSFWLTAASMRVFGANEFAARLPSFLLMAGCGVLVWRMARTQAGAACALLATTVFATTGLVFVAAGAVLTDIALAFGTTLLMAGFWAAVRGPAAGRRLGQALLFTGAAVGLLAKGPVALVLAALPIGAWVAWEGAWRDAWTRVPWLAGGTLTLAVAGPWYWAMEQATPGFLYYFIVGEHWQRFTQAGWTGDRYGSGHAWTRGSIWLFWGLAALPWSIVFLDWLVRCTVAPRARLRERTADPWWRYLAAWAVAPLVLFTLSRNILPAYVLPGLPALALLLAFGPFAAATPRKLDRAELRGLVAAVLLGVGFALLVIGAHERIGREYSQRALVRSFEQARGQGRLVYLGDVPASASFYTRGRVAHVRDAPSLAAWLADARGDFFAIRDGDAPQVTPALRARLVPHGRFGAYTLYAEAPLPR